MPPREPSRYPKLPPHLVEQLRRVPPSGDRWITNYPCCVRLNDGTELDRVYLVAEIPFIKIWGLYPDQDRGKAEILVSDIASLMDSPTRLPGIFANELYRAGESGMGYSLFTVIFKSDNSSVQSSQAYVTGGAVDFIDYPEGKGPTDVVRVLPHIGRESKHLDGPKYYWCLYSE
jgi:hypothetical protein